MQNFGLIGKKSQKKSFTMTTEPINLAYIKSYVEGPQAHYKCTENVPKSLTLLLDLFINEIIAQIKKDPSQITPHDISDVINNTPEYSFLCETATEFSRT